MDLKLVVLVMRLVFLMRYTRSPDTTGTYIIRWLVRRTVSVKGVQLANQRMSNARVAFLRLMGRPLTLNKGTTYYIIVDGSKAAKKGLSS